MEQQEIFETVAVHLFKQGERAFDANGQCAYRGKLGMACAVGCLISDADYHADNMEGLDVFGLAESGQLPSNLVPHIELLNRLQILHDSDRPWLSTEAMRRELNEIGQAFLLNNGFLQSLAFSDDAKRLNLE
jgi:hypothetical protein